MRSDCPISYALDFFGDKWTFLIIRDLVFDGKKFYSDFLRLQGRNSDQYFIRSLEKAGAKWSDRVEGVSKTQDEEGI